MADQSVYFLLATVVYEKKKEKSVSAHKSLAVK